MSELNIPGFTAAMSQRKGGFTIVELLVTIVIISVLATVTMPLAQLSVQRNKEHELKRSLREIREAIDAYKQSVDEGRIIKNLGESGYPPNLEILVKGVVDAKSPSGAKLYFLRRIPRDPFFESADAPPAKTWGKRGYASSADEPKEGVDVYDIYSISNGVGLNGVPYRTW